MDLAAMNAEKKRMEKCFAMVRPVNDWRGPIDAFFLSEALEEAGVSVEELVASIMFFCGGKKAYLISSVGYRNGPCGP
jgi:hypothetical protein